MRETQRKTIGEQIHAQRVARGDFTPPAGSRPAPPVIAYATTDPISAAHTGPTFAAPQPGEVARVARGPAIAASAIGGTVSGGHAINPKGGK
jgi:hypothetical protein